MERYHIILTNEIAQVIAYLLILVSFFSFLFFFYCTGVQSTANILLRELDAGMIPGKCLWAMDPFTPTEVSISSIGVGSKRSSTGTSTSSTATGSNAQKTIHKLIGHGNKTLTVNISDAPVVRPSIGAFRVWAQIWENPGSKLVCASQIVKPYKSI